MKSIVAVEPCTPSILWSRYGSEGILGPERLHCLDITRMGFGVLRHVTHLQGHILDTARIVCSSGKWASRGDTKSRPEVVRGGGDERKLHGITTVRELGGMVELVALVLSNGLVRLDRLQKLLLWFLSWRRSVRSD